MPTPGLPQPSGATALTSSGAVRAKAGFYHGYIVTVATTGAVTLYDNASAASGTVIDVIPTTTAAGTRGVLAQPVPVANGVYASFASGGTVLFLHDA